ncbi:hypothetical protein HMPREF9094_1135 [Fusobacterium animalis ATCC 51191]|uniref:Uncharacterized protein n=1 Tax=Fusobacterium animalis ATCC 51191 TaxID=997347 RepID=F9EMI0_9FUSO|nr:hypothetical protein HMPREF9094_1135 [Fusobacterium animalis ATCC 51191]
MKNYYEKKDGYRETIQKGLNAIRNLSGNISTRKGTSEEQLKSLKNEIQNADAILIGAGAGLSTSAGLIYSGERFEKYFFDFAKKIQDKRYVFRRILSFH